MQKPLLKYPGGKSSELKIIEHLFPSNIKTYVEPFVGGGAVYWDIKANHYIINDISEELVSIYNFVKTQDKIFLSYFKEISYIWDKKNDYYKELEAILKKSIDANGVSPDIKLNFSENLFSEASIYQKNDYIAYFDKTILKILNKKINSLIKISFDKEITNFKDNALGIIGSTLYTLNRRIYNETNIEKNPKLKVALYYFLREFSYSSMFRFNKKGDFNVPFGGNSYAKKSLEYRIKQITDIEIIDKLDSTEITSMDFSEILKKNFHHEDFIFLDPPYDTNFNEYNKNSFDLDDQQRLAKLLIDQTNPKWMLIIKNTEYIYDLYRNPNIYITSFDKNYSVNFKNRNNTSTEHLIITNYNYKRGEKKCILKEK